MTTSPGIDRRSLLRVTGAAMTALVAAACGGRSVPTLRVASGEQGGLFFEFANLLAGAAEGSGVRLEPLESDGSVENLETMTTGRAELALTLLDVAEDNRERLGLTAIGRVYENYFQVAVRRDSPVATIADLAGRTVSVGAPGSGAALLSTRVLAAAGLTDAVRPVQQTMQAAADALARGTIDAAMWAGGLPTPVFTRVAGGIRLLDLGTVGDPMRRRYGGVYEPVAIPEGTYGAHPAVTTVGVMNLLVVRRDVSDESVAAVVDLLLDRSASLVPPQAVGSQFLDAQSLILTGSVPLHPGAAAQYRRRHG